MKTKMTLAHLALIDDVCSFLGRWGQRVVDIQIHEIQRLVENEVGDYSLEDLQSLALYHKVFAIKYYRKKFNTSLMEAKQIVESWRS